MTIIRSLRQDDLRARNRSAVISALRSKPALSRTALVSRTGLSHSTISAITTDLLSDGLLRERSDTAMNGGRRGRPQIALEINPTTGVVVTAVLSLNRFSAAILDYSGHLLCEKTTHFSTGETSRAGLIDIIRDGIADLLGRRAAPPPPLLHIVLAIQGVTDVSARDLLWSPITPHGNIDFADLLEQSFDAPATVENDCNMIALALRWRNPERYKRDFLALLLSHGIGMGLMIRGEVFRGTRSSAGEFGHMNHVPNGALCRCGKRGCIEAYGGNYAIWRRARGLSPDALPENTIDDDALRELLHAARNHPGAEREAFTEAGTAVGYGLGSLFALIDPASVAVVGMGSTAFDLLETPIRDAIAGTAGDQQNEAITFSVEGDEMPLIRDGCVRHALAKADAAIVPSGARAEYQASSSEIE